MSDRTKYYMIKQEVPESDKVLLLADYGTSRRFFHQSGKVETGIYLRLGGYECMPISKSAFRAIVALLEYQNNG